MVLAGKHGAGVLSVSTLRSGSVRSNLGDFWKIAEDTAEEHGNTMNRNEWRLVVPTFLAETKKEAFDQARVGAARFQRDYFEDTMGFERSHDGPAEEIVDVMVEKGAWCVGTPDDLVATINRLDEDSGGFGGLLVQATDWANREQTMHSYELIARYVMPQFQGSVESLNTSQQWAAEKRKELMAIRQKALDKAGSDYERTQKAATGGDD